MVASVCQRSKVRSRDKKSKVRSRVKGQNVAGLVELQTWADPLTYNLLTFDLEWTFDLLTLDQTF